MEAGQEFKTFTEVCFQMNYVRLKRKLTEILLFSFLFVGEKTTRKEAWSLYKKNEKIQYYIDTQVYKILKLVGR